MKRPISLLSLIALWVVLMASQTALADANLDLATSKSCLNCHAIDKKVLGPAYKDVAAKYVNQKNAVAKLTQKVLKGGSGVWGAVPMPANAQVNEAEAKQLVTWILNLK